MAALKRYPLPYLEVKKLVHAVIAGNLQAVQQIVPEEVDVNQTITPYPGGVSTYLSFLAVDHNRPDVLRYLMDVGLDATVKDHSGLNLFCKVATMHHASKELTDILFNKSNAALGSLLNDQTEAGNTAVHLAVRNLYTLSVMLDMFVDLRVATVRNSIGDTPLAFAIKSSRGNPVAASMLVRYAKQVSHEPFSTTDKDGYTALELANMYALPGLVEEIASPPQVPTTAPATPGPKVKSPVPIEKCLGDTITEEDKEDILIARREAGKLLADTLAETTQKESSGKAMTREGDAVESGRQVVDTDRQTEQIEHLKTTITVRDKTIGALEAELTAMQVGHEAELTAVQVGHEADMADLRTKCEATEEAKITALEDSHCYRMATVTSACDKKLEETKADLYGKIETLNSDLGNAKNARDELKLTLASNDIKISDLEGVATTRDKQLISLKEAFEAANKRMEELTSELSEEKADVDALKSRLRDQDLQITDLTSTLRDKDSTAENTIRSLQEEIEEVATEKEITIKTDLGSHLGSQFARSWLDISKRMPWNKLK